MKRMRFGEEQMIAAVKQLEAGRTATMRTHDARKVGPWMNISHNLQLIIIVLWALLVCFVVLGSLLPATSPLIVSLQVSDKVQHFGAYMLLALLPVLGFENRCKGMLVGLSMFLLGIVMEAGQHFSPGRAVELGDVVANGIGVACGVALGTGARLWL